MLIVETVAKVRRAYFLQKKPIKAICREFHLSRKVVRKVIRSGATEFRYERGRQPLPRIDPWREPLEALLLANEQRSSRERLTLVRIFEEMRGFGYAGSYDAVRRYAKAWRLARGAATAAAFVPLSFAPGEAYQFDWSHEIVVLGGVTTKVKVAHVRLCHSRMPVVRAYPRESQEMVFDAHIRAFEFFKGSCTRGIAACPRAGHRPDPGDNMKTAVEVVFLGKDRQFNRRFLQMCGHYLVEPVACTPAAGWEKGQVENQVGNIRERLFAPRLRVASYDELNAWLLDQCIAYAKANKHPEQTDRTIWQVFEAERPQLVPIGDPFDGFHATQTAVSKTCLVRFDNNKYSVSARGRPSGRDPGWSLSSGRPKAGPVGRAPRHPPGRCDCRRASPSLWSRPDDLRPLALRAGAGPEARRAEKRRAVQRLAVASPSGARTPPAEGLG
jgi:transposase